jgi:hypothetical protein
MESKGQNNLLKFWLFIVQEKGKRMGLGIGTGPITGQ